MRKTIFPVLTENDRKLPFYLIGVGCWYHQEHIIRKDGYPNFQWIQCHSGEGELVIDGRTYPVKPQQGMFLYPDVPHEYYAIIEPWEVDWVTFGGHQLEYLIKTINMNSSVYFVANAEAILAKMRKALSIALSEDSLKGVECSTIVYDILMDLFKFASINSDDSIEQQYIRLQPVFDFIEKNYYKVITLENLARTINVTPQHFCLLFRNIMKTRPFEYINSVRVNKSKELMIKNCSLEIGEIARIVGYEDASYFCSVFRRIEGVSPGSFKKLHGV